MSSNIYRCIFQQSPQRSGDSRGGKARRRPSHRFIGSSLLPCEAGGTEPCRKDREAKAKEARCLAHGEVGAGQTAGVRSLLFSFPFKLPFGCSLCLLVH